MRSRTARTTIAMVAVVVCFGIGTAIGLSATQQHDDETTTPLDLTATDPSGVITAAGETGGSASPNGAGDEGADEDGDGVADEGAQAPEAEGEQAPPEGEERAPAWDPQLPEPNLPQLPAPVWNPPNNGGGNEDDAAPPAPPAPPAQPLSVRVTRLGPGPIWENGWQRRCNGSAMLTSTTVSVWVSEQPRALPFTVTATARVGNTTRNAVVQQEPGQPDRFVVGYGFPRGTVQRPSYPVVTIVVTDANGNRASTSVGGHQGVGHTLYPADSCP